MKNSTEVGEIIHQARKTKGIKQIELSQKVQIKPSTLCDIEKGRTMPSVKTLGLLSQELGLPINIFFN